MSDVCLIILWIYISLKHVEVWNLRGKCLIILWIYISLKLRRQNGVSDSGLIILWIYISLKREGKTVDDADVWLSFEFTYLSNWDCSSLALLTVWLSFEFTYLSNSNVKVNGIAFVWLSFEFTYLSNYSTTAPWVWQFDYPLNLHISQTAKTTPEIIISLIILWIYISLKHIVCYDDMIFRLIILWIYISLKHPEKLSEGLNVWLSFEFTYLSNVSGAKPSSPTVWLSFEFTYLSNDELSDTLMKKVWLSFEFTYLSNCDRQ